ncbi:hypothetical protein K6119_05465 [Paracrocinitomix mangrovi]|uniref:hypothetical protein n=1 Tax=Paracrocinitomix mangrovi TaxID=2862509 RepID=UPI001C8DB4DE|nr:hypothetical protein [Paracrocinitomix mangrovi]UKN02962.1 hypothetical protein K6119_05465 [Paracrocinitomix mangrovi]
MNSLKISDDIQLKELKKAFNDKFPHLKIEFFAEAHEEGEASTYKSMYDENLYLKDIRKSHNEGELSIDGHTKTATFEQNFKDHFGVNVQVWRKSGNMWLQTTTTDDWTLSEQEKKGEEYEF